MLHVIQSILYLDICKCPLHCPHTDQCIPTGSCDPTLTGPFQSTLTSLCHPIPYYIKWSLSPYTDWSMSPCTNWFTPPYTDWSVTLNQLVNLSPYTSWLIFHPTLPGLCHPTQTGPRHPTPTGPCHPTPPGLHHPIPTGLCRPTSTGPCHPTPTGPCHPTQTGQCHPPVWSVSLQHQPGPCQRVPEKAWKDSALTL